MKCPYCGESDDKVILRLHWSKKYSEFICGHCKIEMEFIRDPHMDIDRQLDRLFVAYFDFDFKEAIDAVKSKVENMDEDQLKERLKELNSKIKKGKKK